MRRGNYLLLRQFEVQAKLRASMQVKVSTLFGLRGEYSERHVVLVPREPPPDTGTGSTRRVIHSQLLLFKDHRAAQPECKLWTDGASMARDGDRYLLKLHPSHKKPVNVRFETDGGNLICIAFKPSAHAGHEQQVCSICIAFKPSAHAGHEQQVRPET